MRNIPFNGTMEEKGEKMKGKELRVAISENLHRRYRLVCAILELSVPRQTEELIIQFLEKHKDVFKTLNKEK